jgi:hypothetical protein
MVVWQILTVKSTQDDEWKWLFFCHTLKTKTTLCPFFLLSSCHKTMKLHELRFLGCALKMCLGTSKEDPAVVLMCTSVCLVTVKPGPQTKLSVQSCPLPLWRAQASRRPEGSEQANWAFPLPLFLYSSLIPSFDHWLFSFPTVQCQAVLLQAQSGTPGGAPETLAGALQSLRFFNHHLRCDLPFSLWWHLHGQGQSNSGRRHTPNCVRMVAVHSQEDQIKPTNGGPLFSVLPHAALPLHRWHMAGLRRHSGSIVWAVHWARQGRKEGGRKERRKEKENKQACCSLKTADYLVTVINSELSSETEFWKTICHCGLDSVLLLEDILERSVTTLINMI